MLACLLLAAGLILIRRSRNHKIHHSADNVNEHAVVMLDDETGADLAVPEYTHASPLPGMICLGLGAIALAGYVLLRPPSEYHGLKLSYEEYAMQVLADILLETYLENGAHTVRVLVPVATDPYFEGIVNALRNRLTATGVSMTTEMSLRGNGFDARATVPEIRRAIELVEPNAIIVSLNGMSADRADRLPYRRPAVVVFAPTAALQEYAMLVKRGLADVIVLSRGTYTPHSMIPKSKPLETIRRESFLVLTATNVDAVLRRYRQTIQAATP
jgi:hypothetical protein